MRVGGNQIRPEAALLEKSSRSERKEGASATARADVDKVELSSSGKVEQAIAAEESARAARVAEVKAQIESGGYPLDFQSLSEKIIDDEMGRYLG